MIITKKKQLFLPLASLAIVLLFSVGLFIYNQHTAEAISGWKAGNIMDNSVMANKNTMSASKIQTFLNGKVPSCDTNGTKSASDFGRPDLTHAQYARSQGWQAPPYTCLKNYKQGGKTSAQIIYNAAQKYSINPQVLLVLLQKEQGLVQDTWPLNSQYKSATGYGCPDHAPCDSDYYGLTNQIEWAAKMFRAILNNSPSWYTPYVLGNNYIQYSPTASCGGSTVNIENRATQALYNYTPYQPNKAALDAGYGTAHCGSYGNRNFFLYFTDWFGSTRGNPPKFSFERLAGTSAVLKTSHNSFGDYTKTIVRGNEIFTFYYDSTSKNLHYAKWDGSKWTNQTLDGAGSSVVHATTHDVGKGIDAIVRNGDIQVYYYDATSGDLRHAWTKSGTWHLEVMDGTSSSLGRYNGNTGIGPEVIIYKGNLQLYYHNETTGSIRHAWWPGDGRWHFETLDGTTTSLGKNNDDIGEEIQAFTYGSGLQLYYYDKTNGSIRHAWWPGDGRWHFETMDGTAGSLGGSSADVGSNMSALLYKGKPQLYYYDKTNGELQHAWWPGDGRWHFETMDGKTGSVFQNVINAGSQVVAKQIKDELFIFYYDSFNHAWRTAYWSKGMWDDFNLDGGVESQSGSSASVGGQLSAEVYKSNSIQVFYRDSTGGLAHAWVKGR